MERDGRTWVIMQLSSYGESLAEKGELYSKLRKKIPKNKNIFIPYHRLEFQGKVTKINVLEGYCFVESGLEEREYFNLGLEAYIDNILHTKRNRSITLQTVRDADVEKLKSSLQDMLTKDLEEDMSVCISGGVYKGIDGQIVGFNSDKSEAYVYITLRSLQAIRTIPTVLLTTD